MPKLLRIFCTYAGAAALCLTGVISIQNLIAQLDGMLGGYPGPDLYWDAMWKEPGIHLSFGFVLAFGGVFGLLAYCSTRYNVLTRNHVLIILVGIILFIIAVEYT